MSWPGSAKLIGAWIQCTWLPLHPIAGSSVDLALYSAWCATRPRLKSSENMIVQHSNLHNYNHITIISRHVYNPSIILSRFIKSHPPHLRRIQLCVDDLRTSVLLACYRSWCTKLGTRQRQQRPEGRLPPGNGCTCDERFLLHHAGSHVHLQYEGRWGQYISSKVLVSTLCKRRGGHSEGTSAKDLEAEGHPGTLALHLAELW